MSKLTAEHRTAQIQAKARTLSMERGLYNWTFDDIADACNVSRNTVRYHAISVIRLREIVLRTAIRRREVAIVVQALAMNDPIANEISESLRNECARHLG